MAALDTSLPWDERTVLESNKDYIGQSCRIGNVTFLQCCGSGSGIRCLFGPRALDPGSGMGKKSRSGSGSGMNIPDHISMSLETTFGVNMLIWDGKYSGPGSGINIPDPQHLLLCSWGQLLLLKKICLRFSYSERKRFQISVSKDFRQRFGPRFKSKSVLRFSDSERKRFHTSVFKVFQTSYRVQIQE